MSIEYFSIPTLIGLLGVVLILMAYFLLQIGKLLATSQVFQIMNLLGSAFILLSLYFDFNLPSAIIELAWFGISVMGLIRINRKKLVSK